ncbi:MAG TPA: potassium channel family protein [Thermoanaerobaculia bacterium]
MIKAEMSIAAIVGGTILLLGILWDVFETMVLSRRVSRGTRLTTLFYRFTWPLYRKAARRIPPGNRRENFLTPYGPLSLLLLIGLWAVSLVVAFGLLQWGSGSRVSTAEGGGDFFTTLYMSGTTLFTLGLGDVVPHSSAGRFLTVFESGIGLAFLALVIGYLPILSQAFSAREANIALLDARAGSPPTAAELLRRHGLDHAGEALVGLLRDWEKWSAHLLESHVSFPVLAFYRSQHDNQSWVAGMTAVLDACALVLSTADQREKRLARQARLTFAMARHAVADMCRVLGRKAASPEADRLPAADLALVLASLADAGIVVTADGGPSQKLGELRAMYEPYVHPLSEFLLMPLPPWAPKAPPRDNWLAHF